MEQWQFEKASWSTARAPQMGIHFKKDLLSKLLNAFKINLPKSSICKGILAVALHGEPAERWPFGFVEWPQHFHTPPNRVLQSPTAGLPSLHLLRHPHSDSKGLLALAGHFSPALLSALRFRWNTRGCALISGPWQHAGGRLKIRLLPPHMTRYKENCVQGSWLHWMVIIT